MDEIIKILRTLKDEEKQETCRRYISWAYIDLHEETTVGANPININDLVLDQERRMITDKNNITRLIYNPDYILTGSDHIDNGNQETHYYYLTLDGDKNSQKYLEFILLQYTINEEE